MFALEDVSDYSVLTGIQLLSQFEYNYGYLSKCSDLWNDNESRPGIIGNIAENILTMESICNNLAPFEDGDIARNEWRSNIENTLEAWRNGCTLAIGAKDKEIETPSPSKRQRLSIESSASQNQRKGVHINFEEVLTKFKVSVTKSNFDI